jgi:hypothetical protein
MFLRRIKRHRSAGYPEGEMNIDIRAFAARAYREQSNHYSLFYIAFLELALGDIFVEKTLEVSEQEHD